ncbi:MAG: chlorite dismutase family protein, partial [Nocardioides sp.]|nr:chlorite dismutase family protein [Nocardioides sp.]
MSDTQTNAARLREINDSIRYTTWSVFRLDRVLGDADREAEGAEVEKLLAELAEEGVVVRGVYDVAGLRADADVMVWWHAADSEALQSAYHRFRRTALGSRLAPVWSQMALHRPAEFNKSHVPAFLADEEPKRHVCVYPFVRSYEWYLLPDEERRDMLKEHGMQARPY